jgi:hypothetical protein
MSRQHAINRQIGVKVRQNLLRTRGIAPVSHQIANNGEERDQLHARSLHTGVGCVAYKFGVRTRTLDVGEDAVALSTQSECEERSADVGCDTGDDDLLLAGCFDGGAEFGVIPGTPDKSARNP